MHRLHTVGYEAATIAAVVESLREAGVDLLVDVRAVASSRRPGFAKTKLAANLEAAGIEYRHVRVLGTPADGRAAARAGRHAEMQRIFGEHLATLDAQSALHDVAEWIGDGRRLCLLCFEADPAHCHRALVAAALAERLPLDVVHLRPVTHPKE
ncbi:MAG TPA: DUF488 domain-containing protein [Gemmatimonadaceae bacterium]|nr:DUF488 domain-containing protein [Gemmatimonadaceae bacterium]